MPRLQAGRHARGHGCGHCWTKLAPPPHPRAARCSNARAPLDRRRAAPGKVTFARDTGFHGEVKRRVLAYFARTGLSQRDSPRMYLKTAVMLVWFGASYALLVFGATTLWQGALLALSLALAMAGIGFGIQHDANHGAYSSRAAVNRVLGLTLDMLGASSYVWRFKHNVSHHTYTNIDGRRRRHRRRPVRAAVAGAAALPPAPLPALLHVGALLVPVPEVGLRRRLQEPRRGRESPGTRFPRPRGADLRRARRRQGVVLRLGVVIPLLFHPWWVVLLFYGATSFVLGITLAVVFQLAHCVEEADFPVPPPGRRLSRRGRCTRSRPPSTSRAAIGC